MHQTTIGLLAAALTLTNVSRADEVIDQIDTAKKAYESGELRSAVETLNFAVAKIQEQMTESLLKLLPEALDGWTADPPESQSGGMAAMITGTTLSRRYARADGAEVTLNLMADSPMMPMLTMAMSMPFVMQSNQDMKTYSFKGHRGMVEHAADTTDYEVTLMVGNRLVIQGQGSQLEDIASIEAYLERLDLDAIQAALTK
ncbi:hypothetical protein G3480_14575 [Thiorhodococcus mannitoliphagus]|uniref:Uncharacterized protein n=2 Tax=Thiorhodococcus mannitoliphagus TaxID=329406 RepID=A0A6P1DUU1_9GAMM|nr:hypothetical protein [Thiorhodococcus mannitoliphagus]NEX21519.1 hypothetical protein [Thiorhodococcus mannitoliphagus]